MTIDTTKLRELAQKATPGPWTYFPYPKYKEHHVSLPIDGSGMTMPLFPDGCQTSRQREDAEYIAAVNPATVLQLLDDLEHLRVSTANQSQTIARLQKVERAMHQGEKVGCRCTYTDNRVIDTECEYHRAIRAERDRLRTIEAAARNLVKVKGRHNSELAMNQLLEALK